MLLTADTDLLRRILPASLPSGSRAAEMFLESRVSASLALDGEHDAPPASLARRWETGAHLRRFWDGRHESFVLDAPTPESLEALALHPEAVAVEWLGGEARLGVRRNDADTALPARLVDGSPMASAGLWSAEWLKKALDEAGSWLRRLQRASSGCGGALRPAVSIEALVQEVLVLATDRDPARDTRAFVDLTLSLGGGSGARGGWRQTISAARLEQLAIGPSASTLAEDLVARAGRERESRVSPRGEMPVVFAPPSGGYLLHEICGHLLEADHILRGVSPFSGARGQAIASPLLTLADDGSIPGMRGSSLFDDEGVAARRTLLVMEGTLVGYLSDRLTSPATDGISTGNGRRQSYRDAPMPRMTNLVIDPGQPGFDDIVAATPQGLLVTRLGRGHVNPATGRFGLAVEEGFLIESGRATAPVSGVALRGAARELLQRIDAVGCDPRADDGAPLCVKDDQAIPFGIRQPTLRVSRIGVAGIDA